MEDTQKALRDLAAWYKNRFSIPFVAVTGSVGKTTAKDMLAAVLGVKYKVLKTEGNFNNNVGLPLTLLRPGTHSPPPGRRTPPEWGYSPAARTAGRRPR